MTHFTRLARGINIAQIKEQLSDHPELWDAYNRRRTAPGTAHSRMSDIWVRYNDVSEAMRTGEWSRINDKHIPVWYPAWHKLPALRPLVFDTMAMVEGEMLGGVLITRIPPGARIDPHVDEGWHVEFYEKFYLSIQSEPGADFVCEVRGNVERVNPQQGELYLFDNRKRHWVENNSPKDRITVIMCIRTDRFGRY